MASIRQASNAAVHTDEDLDIVSKSQRKRDANAVLKFASFLIGLPERRLAAFPLPADILDLIRESRHVTRHVAAKRQRQFVAKQLRHLDPDELEAAMTFEDEQLLNQQRQQAMARRWTERLLDAATGRDALTELMDIAPTIDGPTVRRLMRDAARAADPLHSPPAHQLQAALERALPTGGD